MEKKTIGIIAGAAGAVVVIGGVAIGAAIITSSPKYMLANAVENTYKDFQKIESYQVLNNVANGGSVEVSADLSKLETGIDLTAAAKIYLDANSIKTGSVVSLKDDDEVVADGQFYFSHDSLVFVSDTLLEDSYGISFKDAKKNLPGSVFDPDEETDYKVPEQMFENWMEIETIIKNTEGLRDDYEALGKEYRKMLIQYICEDAEITKGKDTIKTADGKISCKTVTIKLDEEVLASSLEKVTEYALNDKKLEDIITRYAAVQSLAKDEEAEDIKDDMYDQLEDLKDSLEDLENQSVDMELVFYIAGGRVAAIDFEFEDDDDSASFNLVLGKDISTSKEISLSAESGKESFEIIYTVAEDSDKSYESEIEITAKSSSSTEKMSMSIEWDKKGGDFEVAAKSNGETIKLAGTLEEKDDLHTITIDSFKADLDGENLNYKPGFVIVLDEKDEIPSTPKFTEILTMDDSDFEDLSEELQKNIQKLAEKYGPKTQVDIEDEY